MAVLYGMMPDLVRSSALDNGEDIMAIFSRINANSRDSSARHNLLHAGN